MLQCWVWSDLGEKEQRILCESEDGLLVLTPSLVFENREPRRALEDSCYLQEPHFDFDYQKPASVAFSAGPGSVSLAPLSVKMTQQAAVLVSFFLEESSVLCVLALS